MGWFSTGFRGEKELKEGDHTDDSKNPYKGSLMEYLYSRLMKSLQNVDFNLKLGLCSVAVNTRCLDNFSLLLGLFVSLYLDKKKDRK